MFLGLNDPNQWRPMWLSLTATPNQTCPGNCVICSQERNLVIQSILISIFPIATTLTYIVLPGVTQDPTYFFTGQLCCLLCSGNYIQNTVEYIHIYCIQNTVEPPQWKSWGIGNAFHLWRFRYLNVSSKNVPIMCT